MCFSVSPLKTTELHQKYISPKMCVCMCITNYTKGKKHSAMKSEKKNILHPSLPVIPPQVWFWMVVCMFFGLPSYLRSNPRLFVLSLGHPKSFLSNFPPKLFGSVVTWTPKNIPGKHRSPQQVWLTGCLGLGDSPKVSNSFKQLRSKKIRIFQICEAMDQSTCWLVAALLQVPGKSEEKKHLSTFNTSKFMRVVSLPTFVWFLYTSWYTSWWLICASQIGFHLPKVRGEQNIWKHHL